MAAKRITIAVRFSWWVRPYLYGVALTAWLTGLTPDFEKVKRTVQRGTHAKVVPHAA